MGAEFGQFKEWAYKEGLEFFLKKYEKHSKLSRFFSELNKFYLNEPCLYGDDDGWDGFEWLLADDSDNNVIAYKRRYMGQEIICVLNFSGLCKQVSFGSYVGEYEVVFNSDMKRYGGNARFKKRKYKAKQEGNFNYPARLCVDVEALSFVYLKKKNI